MILIFFVSGIFLNNYLGITGKNKRTNQSWGVPQAIWGGIVCGVRPPLNNTGYCQRFQWLCKFPMNDVNFNIKRNIPSFLDLELTWGEYNTERLDLLSFITHMTSKTIDIILEHMVYIGIDNRMQVLNMCHVVNLCMIRSLFLWLFKPTRAI